MKNPYFLPLIMLFVIFGCSNDSETTTPPIGTYDALVLGNVVDQNDNAVSRANILIAFNTKVCGNDGFTVAANMDVNGQGEFRRIIQDPSPITIRCLQFLVSSPDDNFQSTILNESVDIFLKEEEPLDSYEVTIHVEAN